MITLIGIELKKYFRIKTLVVIAIFILLSTLFTLNGNRITNGAVRNIRDLNYAIKLSEEGVKQWSEELAIAEKKGNAADINIAKDNLKSAQETLDIWTMEKEATTKEKRLDLKIKRFEMSLDGKKPVGVTSFNRTNLIKNLEQYKQYKSTQVIPDDDKLTSLTFVQKFPLNFNALYLSILIIVLTANALSSERGSTLVGYMALPLTKGKVILAKFIATIIVSVVIFTLYEVILFTILGFTNGFGPLNTSVAVGAQYINNNGSMLYKEGTQLFISGYKFVALATAYQTLYIACVASVGFLVSVLFKKSTTSVSIGVGIMLIIYTLSNSIVPQKAMAKYIFSSYGDVSGMLTGALQENMKNINLIPNNGLITMVVTIAVCFLTAYMVFKAQEIYN